MSPRYGNIVGWAKYLPERVLTNADLEQMVDTSDEWIVSRTGIRERRIVSEGEATSHLAVEASRQALEMAGVRARDLGLIIVATSSPDHLTPPISSQVQHALGATDVGAFTLVAGLTWAASVVKLGAPTIPLPEDRAWLKRFAWNPLGSVAAGVGRAVAAISGSVARLVGWVRQG